MDSGKKGALWENFVPKSFSEELFTHYVPQRLGNFSLFPEEWLCICFPQIPKSDSIYHMSHSQMRPELPPLPASANEEPSELYKVRSPGCYSSAGNSWGSNRLDR